MLRGEEDKERAKEEKIEREKPARGGKLVFKPKAFVSRFARLRIVDPHDIPNINQTTGAAHYGTVYRFRPNPGGGGRYIPKNKREQKAIEDSAAFKAGICRFEGEQPAMPEDRVLETMTVPAPPTAERPR